MLAVAFWTFGVGIVVSAVLCIAAGIGVTLSVSEAFVNEDGVAALVSATAFETKEAEPRSDWLAQQQDGVVESVDEVFEGVALLSGDAEQPQLEAA